MLESVSQVFTPKAIKSAVAVVHFYLHEPKLAVRAESSHKADCGEDRRRPLKVIHKSVVGGADN